MAARNTKGQFFKGFCSTARYKRRDTLGVNKRKIVKESISEPNYHAGKPGETVASEMVVEADNSVQYTLTTDNCQSTWKEG